MSDAYTGLHTIGRYDYIKNNKEYSNAGAQDTAWPVPQHILDQWHKEGWEQAKKEEEEMGRAKFLAHEFKKVLEEYDDYDEIGVLTMRFYANEILKALEEQK